MGEEAEIVYAGVREGLTYVAPFIQGCYFEWSTIVRQGAFDWKELGCFLNSIEGELLILMASVATIEQFSQQNDVIGASRIHQEMDVSGGWDYIKSQFSRREGKRREQCIKQGFHYDISHKDCDFYEFYHSMHVPTMKGRYGDLARSVEEKEAYASLFKQGLLFRVSRGQEWVAGSVSQIDEFTRTLNARLIGVKNGSSIYRNDGSQNFTYHSIIEWAASRSDIDSVDFQGCEPFLTKGTFQYKKRFGTRAVIPGNVFGSWRLLIRVKVLTRSARCFLINNPLLIVGVDGALSALYFFDGDNNARLDIPFVSKGIEGAVFLDLDLMHG